MSAWAGKLCELCDTPVLARGLCRKHYDAQRATGQYEKRPAQCTHEQCEQPVHARGLCRKHYDAQRQGVK